MGCCDGWRWMRKMQLQTLARSDEKLVTHEKMERITKRGRAAGGRRKFEE